MPASPSASTFSSSRSASSATSSSASETKTITVSAAGTALVAASVAAAAPYAVSAEAVAYTTVVAASPTAATTATRRASEATATTTATSAGLSAAMSINSQIRNYLSSKQCCLESLTVEALDKLKIGSSDARCKQKEVIFGNILFEILSCLEFSDTYANYTRCYLSTRNMNTTLYPIITALYVGDLTGTYTTLTPFLLNPPGMTALDYFTLIANAVNSYTTQSGGYTADLTTDNGNVCITVYAPSTEAITLKTWSISNGSSSYNSYPMTSTSIADECLTEDDVCVIAPYLNKICESC
jgi:hypothetical protein